MYALYINIPFCLKKCYYCNFKTDVLPFSSKKTAIMKNYTKAIKNEMLKYKGSAVKSIYIGGGTPTAFSKLELAKVLKFCYKNFAVKKNSEITMEANPGTLDEAKLKLLKSEGVNRLSIGLQTTDNYLLEKIGRIHTYEQFLENFYAARKVGFDNINVDLIFALPTQTMDGLKKDVDKILRLRPEHISLYGLSIESGTKMYRDRELGVIKNCDEDLEGDMYEYAINRLVTEGYQHYEISNFALVGKSSIHNQIYWKNGQYIGIGAGASSYINGVRSTNVYDVNEYVNKVYDGDISIIKEKLIGKRRIGEQIILGLRMQKGIKVSKKIKIFFNETMEELICKGLLIKEGENIRLTYRGRLVANHVFVEFV